ncbi:MAG: hypothetical protein Q7T49_03045 [bacterium]|nr:hypothetical protein [bacterium]
MITVVYDHLFTKQVTKLELRLQRKLATLLKMLAHNPYDSRLHTKHLTEPLAGIISFRITRDWRVTFHFTSPTTIHLLEVKHRKDIYR